MGLAKISTLNLGVRNMNFAAIIVVTTTKIPLRTFELSIISAA